MKTANILKAAVLTAVLGGAATSCENKEPEFHMPCPNDHSFQILTPTYQDLYYELTETGTFELVLSGQPDYGFSAVTQYRALVALTEDGFDNEATYREIVPTGTGTLSRMTLNDVDLATAICSLRGIESKNEYTDAGIQKLYFRGYAFIEGVENSGVYTSNTTTLNKVQSFFSVAKPGELYVIGNYIGGWISPEEAFAADLAPYTLFENANEIRSKIYHGTINFDPALASGEGSVFRFYTALDGWDNSSVGCAGGTDDDKPVEFNDFVAGSTLEHGVTKTKDSFKLSKYRGILTMTVDLNTNKAIIEAPAQ